MCTICLLWHSQLAQFNPQVSRRLGIIRCVRYWLIVRTFLCCLSETYSACRLKDPSSAHCSVPYRWSCVAQLLLHCNDLAKVRSVIQRKPHAVCNYFIGRHFGKSIVWEHWSTVWNRKKGTWLNKNYGEGDCGKWKQDKPLSSQKSEKSWIDINVDVLAFGPPIP